jgi:hypothetical protein
MGILRGEKWAVGRQALPPKSVTISWTGRTVAFEREWKTIDVGGRGLPPYRVLSLLTSHFSLICPTLL